LGINIARVKFIHALYDSCVPVCVRASALTFFSWEKTQFYTLEPIRGIGNRSNFLWYNNIRILANDTHSRSKINILLAFAHISQNKTHFNFWALKFHENRAPWESRMKTKSTWLAQLWVSGVICQFAHLNFTRIINLLNIYSLLLILLYLLMKGTWIWPNKIIISVLYYTYVRFLVLNVCCEHLSRFYELFYPIWCIPQ